MLATLVPYLEVVHERYLAGDGGGSGRVHGDRGDGGGGCRDSVAVLDEVVAGVLAEADPPVVDLMMLIFNSQFLVSKTSFAALHIS